MAQFWPQVKPIILRHQPSGRLPKANARGWIGPIHSPLRDDKHPSFSVLPDSETDAGAFFDYATRDHGSMAELAQCLGIKGNYSSKRITSNLGFSGTKMSANLVEFCRKRRLNLKYLQKNWRVKEVTYKGRTAIRYPTGVGVDRIKFLDSGKPKYLWAGKGGKSHWYGLSSALELSDELYIVNGEPSVWAAQQEGVAATCLCSGEAAIPSRGLIEELCKLGPRKVLVVFDQDDAGRQGALALVENLRKFGIDAVALELPEEVGEQGDIDDLHQIYGNRLGEILSQLPKLEDKTVTGDKYALFLAAFEGLSQDSAPSEIEAALRRLSASLLSSDSLEVNIAREAAIQRLQLLNIKAPARLVNSALSLNIAEKEVLDHSGATLFLEDPEQWYEEVDGIELLHELAECIDSYVALPEYALEGIVLWILHTHAHDAALVSALLALVSPEKRCGKTTLLQLLSALVPRPLPASNITAAALFRSVERFHPTLLVDEMDTFLRQNEELRGILNSGHNRATAYVVRTVGEDFEPRSFATWAPKAVALIGMLPSTLEDRSIVIPMRRRSPEEKLEQLRLDRLNYFEPLRRKAARWTNDHFEKLYEADPEIPIGLDDRAADNWRPLFAIADAVGGKWPKRAREVALGLSGAREGQSESSAVLLLHDLLDLFERFDTQRLTSAQVIAALAEMEERPWPEWRKGRPITTRQLAKILRPFGIQPKVLRIGDATPRGYERADFEDAFSRYLTDHLQQPQHPQYSKACSLDQSATSQYNVAHRKPNISKGLNDVADVADLDNIPEL